MSSLSRHPLLDGWKILGALLVAAFLSGCLDYDEEMWLNGDLSGRVNMVISVQEEIVKGATGLEKDLSEAGVRRDVERLPGVKLESFESFREAGKVIAKLRITFDSLEKLTRHETTAGESTPLSLLGAINLRKEGRKWILERTLTALPETKTKSTASDLLTKGLGSLLFSKNHLTYKLHLPGEIITANSQRIDGKEHVVEWNFTLAQAMREPPVMRVEWKKGFPWLWLVAGSGLGIAFVARKMGRAAETRPTHRKCGFVRLARSSRLKPSLHARHSQHRPA